MNSAAVQAPAYVFRKHTAPVNAATLFANDQYLASSDASGMVLIWKMRSRRVMLEWQAHEKDCTHIVVYDNGSRLISQGRDNMIHVWGLLLDVDGSSSKELLQSIPYVSLNFCRLSLCKHQGDTLVALPFRGDTTSIDVYCLEKDRWIYHGVGEEEKEQRRLCMAVQLFSRGSNVYCLAGYEDGSVCLWQMDQKRLLWDVKEHSEPILDLAVDMDHQHGISTSAGRELVKYALFGDPEAPVVNKTLAKKSGLNTVAIRHDNKIVATGGLDGRIRVFSFKSLKPLAVLSYHRESIYSIGFAEKVDDSVDHWLIGASKDTRISMWSLY
ncbi:guanine nucleotide-binding protein subunit beta-like protein 1 [Lichtheimia corymbifera JMRC:FSU:9682]|uniref:ASTRA-associated protein 1 n=1 Tax=Lichtheimia corymbifera JMRC:FSU:9682 TaxID=1263082 RepID=A0A068S7Z9_9FUNG|nr:guanine nucleotide-binding protein subunit beta-like protein 1 [Lichtheimia corymbifera JMRC:FSU:9682]